MDYSEAIIKEYDEMADRRVATVCRINITFMVIVGLLNILGIFIIDMNAILILHTAATRLSAISSYSFIIASE